MNIGIIFVWTRMGDLFFKTRIFFKMGVVVNLVGILLGLLVMENNYAKEEYPKVLILFLLNKVLIFCCQCLLRRNFRKLKKGYRNNRKPLNYIHIRPIQLNNITILRQWIMMWYKRSIVITNSFIMESICRIFLILLEILIGII